MKSCLLPVVLAGFSALSTVAASAQEANPGAIVPDNYIVQLRPGAGPAAVAARHGLAPRYVYVAALDGFAGFIPPGQLRRIAADADVVAIIPDREVVATGKPSDPGNSKRGAQVIPAGVARIGADQLFGSVSAAGVGVAVVDTGVDFSHPDLHVGSASYSAIPRGTGMDDNGHGTHVAGTIAAKDDDFDVVGVAPDATLYAVKVLNRLGAGSDATIIAGLDWIAANWDLVDPNILVVNMSLGRPGSLDDNPPYRTAVQTLHALGITVVVSAGNDCGAEVSAIVPACFPEVIAVASTTALDGVSSYPGFSGIPVDTASFFTTDGPGVAVSAPGEDQENVSRNGTIRSVGILSTQLRGGTTRMSGTSMASPHVAGVAALIYATKQHATPETVRRRIVSTADGTDAVPLPSPTACYSFDDGLEGVVSAIGAVE